MVLGLGVFISTISQTTGQAIQTAFFFLLPQILLSGMIFPLDAMAAGVRWIGYLLPLTYFTMISQGVMLRGASLASLWLAVPRAHRDGGGGLHRRHAAVPSRPGPGTPRTARGERGAAARRARGPERVMTYGGPLRDRPARGHRSPSTTSRSGRARLGRRRGRAATAPARRRCCAPLVGEVALDARHRGRAADPRASATCTASCGQLAGLTVRQNMDFVGGIYGLSGSRLEQRRERAARPAPA